nr:MAG TPA: hypothetical protein [Caudoviricetes sp.]
MVIYFNKEEVLLNFYTLLHAIILTHNFLPYNNPIFTPFLPCFYLC